MKKLLIFLTVILTITLAGCNPFSSSDDDNNYVGPVAVKAPASAAAFSNTTISINPTITFTNGAFTYVNNSDDTSEFPAAGGATLTGTYVYNPNPADDTVGTMTMTFSDSTKLELAMSNFFGTSTAIQSFKVTIGAKSFNVAVTAGTMAPKQPVVSTGTGTGTGTGVTTLPSAISGKVMTLTLDYKADTAPAAFGYSINDTEVFTFSSSGLLLVGTSTPTPSRNVGYSTKVGSEYIWHDSEKGYYYAVSLKTDGSFNEINVSSAQSQGTFYGQFVQK